MDEGKEKRLEGMFPKEIGRVREGKCPFCGVSCQPQDFRDPLSLKEWQISGICQACQDNTFGGGENDVQDIGPERRDDDIAI